MRKSKICVVCGKKLGFFEMIIGNTCSIQCQYVFDKFNNLDSFNKKDNNSKDKKINSSSKIKNNRISTKSYNKSKVLDYDDYDYVNDDIDYYENVNQSTYKNNHCIYDDYNNSYDGGYSGYENHWDGDTSNDNDF